MTAPTATPAEFFAGHPLALAAFERVQDRLSATGRPFTIRITKSQLAFRRRRGFAYLWLPGRYLAHPAADVVLTLALGRPLPSDRFKQVAHPAPTVWMHHLEIHELTDLDDEVAGWLLEAADEAV